MREREQAGWFNRPRVYWRERLQNETFDLIIIGGGITGAGIAREATLAGLRVALLEAHDYASGTSSRSTKLIHGGLRYLAQGHLRLVREAGSERAVLRRLAPHLVEPVPFLLPIYRGMQHGKFAMGMAVWLYDCLAGVEKKERRQVLSTARLLEQHPELAEANLQGGVRYHEYVTDDARLTLATLQSATEWGAVVMNDAPVTSLLLEEGRVCGVRAVDRATGQGFTVRGHMVVNAAGPWIENVLALDHVAAAARQAAAATATASTSTEGELSAASTAKLSKEESRVTHSRGIHLSFSSERLSIPHALAIQTQDGRLVFIIPKRDVTYLGTTDKRYDGDLLHPIVPEDEVAYLLEIANRILPDTRLTREDVVGIWSGVRPLVTAPGTDSKDTKDVSREDEIWVSPAGLVTIAGGKLTAYRKMAERILAKVREQLPQSGSPTQGNWRLQEKLSAVLPLYGAKEIPPHDYANWLDREADRLTGQFPLSTADAKALIRRYGDRAETIFAVGLLPVEEAAQRIVPEIPLLEGEIPYMVRVESALHVTDVLSRRTELGRFRGLLLRDVIEKTALRMQLLLGWTDEQRQSEVARCERECHLPLLKLTARH
jgi:glycerol-3-phosphate dehydrogenase